MFQKGTGGSPEASEEYKRSIPIVTRSMKNGGGLCVFPVPDQCTGSKDRPVAGDPMSSVVSMEVRRFLPTPNRRERV